MKKIVKKLMKNGMGFEYEHNGSRGEKVKCHELDLEITVDDTRIFVYGSGFTMNVDEDTEIEKVLNKIDELVVEYTN